MELWEGTGEREGASLVAQRLKRLPAMQETWVRSVGWEGPLEKEMATHCSILTRRIPWTRVLEWGAIAFSFEANQLRLPIVNEVS